MVPGFHMCAGDLNSNLMPRFLFIEFYLAVGHYSSVCYCHCICALVDLVISFKSPGRFWISSLIALSLRNGAEIVEARPMDNVSPCRVLGH